MSKVLSSGAPEDGHRVETAYDVVYNWNYGSEISELRRLYTKALDLQWMAVKDLPWDKELDRDAFSSSFTMGGIPVQELDFWKSLSTETQWEVSRRGAAFMLSNFLHGEQGALMVASQLVSAVPHTDGKFYAATQTLDEARHVEVFAAYIEKLDHVYAIAPSLRDLLDGTLSTSNWMMKCVGMQIVVEGLALYTFREMRNATREPLLAELLTYVGRDEARHTAYGVKYLGAVVPSLGAAQIAEIEDFAFEAARLLIDSRRGATFFQGMLARWQEAGVDPGDVLGAFDREKDKVEALIHDRGGRRGPITGFVVPTLRNIGLFSERIEGHFREMFAHMQGPDSTGNIMDDIKELPTDLEAWIEDGARFPIGRPPGRADAVS